MGRKCPFIYQKVPFYLTKMPFYLTKVPFYLTKVPFFIIPALPFFWKNVNTILKWTVPRVLLIFSPMESIINSPASPENNEPIPLDKLFFFKYLELYLDCRLFCHKQFPEALEKGQHMLLIRVYYWFGIATYLWKSYCIGSKMV